MCEWKNCYCQEQWEAEQQPKHSIPNHIGVAEFFWCIFSQILACGYINTLIKNNCWLIQLLSLACTIKEYKDLQGKEQQEQLCGLKLDKLFGSNLLLH